MAASRIRWSGPPIPGGNPVELGIHFANFTLPGGSDAIGPVLGRTAQAAEAGGRAAFTLMDHYFQMEEFAERHDPMSEGYMALGFLAGPTERMTLGLLVTGVTYRLRAC